jgi:hypothetical protein
MAPSRALVLQVIRHNQGGPVPLDVTLVREGVRWSREAAVAFRHGVQALEDHLLGLGVDDADLAVQVQRTANEADIHAVLRIGPDRLDYNGEDLDLAYGLTQVLTRLRELASAERLFDDGRGPVLDADAPWEGILDTVVAMASRMVTLAVDVGDLPAGAVDPRDLADDAIVVVLEQPQRTMRAVRRELRNQLERRIDHWVDRAGDVSLDEVENHKATPMTGPEDDPFYEYVQPDESPLRHEDTLDADERVTDDDRMPPRPDR